MENKIKSYKGFNEDMTCRGFQYKEGGEYEEKQADVCNSGFHACEYPLDCFCYYSPNCSVYHEVEQEGEFSKRNNGDSKIASTKIKIGAQINIAGLVKAAIEYTTERVKKEADSDESHGASSATGDYGASSATGDYGASSATGNCGASSATGYKGASSVTNPESIAVAWGYHGKARGVKGAYLVLADWEGDEKCYWEQDKWRLKGAEMVRVDGEKIKENIWYTMVNGKVVEVEDVCKN
ncbi:DUF7666 domain-containing protein [Anaerobutyricum hallii]|uniref:DUF7666 domain-containing protein n=1 Tax=Anaerobutyricum hallii TaxID=39488 RepID=UPI00266FE432|nr:hypothetical protein [Anaerobutyricum hallii]